MNIIACKYDIILIKHTKKTLYISHTHQNKSLNHLSCVHNDQSCYHFQDAKLYIFFKREKKSHKMFTFH